MKNNFKIHCKVELDTTSVESLIKDYYKKLCPETFYENGEKQCNKGKSRSFYDLLSLVEYYFKGNRKSELADVLCWLLMKNEIGCLFCGNINKVVFYSWKLHPCHWSYKFNLDSNNFNTKYRNTDKIGCDDLADKIGCDGLSINIIYNLSKECK